MDYYFEPYISCIDVTLIYGFVKLPNDKLYTSIMYIQEYSSLLPSYNLYFLCFTYL